MGGCRERLTFFHDFKDGVLTGTKTFSLKSLIKVKCAMTQALLDTY